MVCIVAVMGFDERHVLKSLLRLGFRNVNEVHLITPAGRKDPRAEDAISRIRHVAEAAGVQQLKIHDIEYTDYRRAVFKIASILRSLSIKDDVLISLGGGMRVLVIETLIASLSLPEELKRTIKVTVDSEAGPEYIEFKPEIPKIPALTEEKLAILKETRMKGKITVKEVSTILSIPVSTAWKILNELLKAGCMAKEKRGIYKLTQECEPLLP